MRWGGQYLTSREWQQGWCKWISCWEFWKEKPFSDILFLWSWSTNFPFSNQPISFLHFLTSVYFSHAEFWMSALIFLLSVHTCTSAESVFASRNTDGNETSWSQINKRWDGESTPALTLFKSNCVYRVLPVWKSLNHSGKTQTFSNKFDCFWGWRLRACKVWPKWWVRSRP